jgi:hypothetical protein
MPEYPLRKARNPAAVGLVGGADFTIGAEDTNAITVNIQLKNQWGKNLAYRAMIDWVLFGDANGDTLPTALTSVAAGTDGWVSSTVTGLRGVAGCEADGDLDMVFTLSSGARTVYLGIRLSDGTYAISDAITFAG